MSVEEWRPWRDGIYEVSSLGNVRRVAKGHGRGRIGPLRLMKIGYYLATVHDQRKEYVHAMVAECFLGPRPEGRDINHIDGVKTNNCVDNLEYVSHAENMAHASRTGLMSQGSKHPNASLTEDDVRVIRARREAGDSLTELMRDFPVQKPALSMICNRKTWRHVA